MTTTELTKILPTDSKGRVRVSRQRREQLMEEFERSGMTGAQFAKTVGVKYSTFAFWRQEQRRGKPALVKEGLPGKTATVEWLETVIDKAQASGPAASSALIVRLPSGATIELGGAAQAPLAAALLRAWEKPAC